MITAVEPAYPDSLKSLGIEGTVVLQAAIDTSGQVDSSSVKVVRSLNPGLDAAAAHALVASRFSPARSGGRAVRVVMQIPYAFRFKEAPAPVAGDSTVAPGARPEPAPPAAGLARAAREPGPATEEPAPAPATEGPATPTEEPAPATEEPGSVPIGPRLASMPRVAYPRELKGRAIEGTGFLRARVTETGAVDPSSVVIVTRLDPELDRVAADALRASTFLPATEDGHPVAATVHIAFTNESLLEASRGPAVHHFGAESSDDEEDEGDMDEGFDQ
jgi:TonB family protein